MLTSFYGVPAEEATAVALVDFVISTLSVIVIGGILYAFSGRSAGSGLAHAGVPSGCATAAHRYLWVIGTHARDCDPAVARTHHRSPFSVSVRRTDVGA